MCSPLFPQKEERMLISYHNFKESRTRIAGIDALRDGCPTESAQRIINDVEDYISTYEPRFLRKLLGPNHAVIVNRNKDLREMLINSAGGYSVVAAYIYFFYERDHATANTLAGEKVFVSDATLQISANSRLCRLWNDMVEECRYIAQYASDSDVSPDWDADIFHKINTFNL